MHTINHRGLTYVLDVTIDSDGRTVIDMELAYATWTTREASLDVLGQAFEIGLGPAFWPSTIPTPEVRVNDGLATVLYIHNQSEILAALERDIVDAAVAVKEATG